MGDLTVNQIARLVARRTQPRGWSYLIDRDPVTGVTLRVSGKVATANPEGVPVGFVVDTTVPPLTDEAAFETWFGDRLRYLDGYDTG